MVFKCHDRLAPALTNLRGRRRGESLILPLPPSPRGRRGPESLIFPRRNFSPPDDALKPLSGPPPQPPLAPESAEPFPFSPACHAVLSAIASATAEAPAQAEEKAGMRTPRDLFAHCAHEPWWARLLECADMSALLDEATCRLVRKRRQNSSLMPHCQAEVRPSRPGGFKVAQASSLSPAARRREPFPGQTLKPPSAPASAEPYPFAQVKIHGQRSNRREEVLNNMPISTQKGPPITPISTRQGGGHRTSGLGNTPVTAWVGASRASAGLGQRPKTFWRPVRPKPTSPAGFTLPHSNLFAFAFRRPVSACSLSRFPL